MSEKLDQPKETEGKERIKNGKIVLANEMIERKEIFPFPEITDETYYKIKADEAEMPDYAEYATPIDELLARCKAEGIKVAHGNHPDSGNIFILPALSESVERDCLFPRQLKISNATSDHLKKLIALDGGQE